MKALGHILEDLMTKIYWKIKSFFLARTLGTRNFSPLLQKEDVGKLSTKTLKGFLSCPPDFLLNFPSWEHHHQQPLERRELSKCEHNIWAASAFFQSSGYTHLYLVQQSWRMRALSSGCPLSSCAGLGLFWGYFCQYCLILEAQAGACIYQRGAY